MHPQDTLDRRTALQALASGSLAPLAGCLSGDGTTTTRKGTATSPTPTATGVFEDVFFEAQDMVVDLQDDAGVSQVNLIGPEGSKVAGAGVPTGATRVRLQILDINLAGGGYDHYPQGEHELIAQLTDGTDSTTIQLQPSLHISGISKYSGGDKTKQLGNLAVEVTNTGTAPTWVYDITFENAPNRSVNDELVDDPGVPQIANHETAENLIVEPQEEALFVSIENPLVFRDQENPSCGGGVDLTITVGTAVGRRLRREVRVTVDGEPVSIGLTGQFVCDDLDIKSTSATSTTESSQEVDE